jgi:hypothetical protein
MSTGNRDSDHPRGSLVLLRGSAKLERAAADGSRLTQQIALPRMARFSSLSATIMRCCPEDKSGMLCVSVRALMILDCVLRSTKTISNCTHFIICPSILPRTGATM